MSKNCPLLFTWQSMGKTAHVLADDPYLTEVGDIRWDTFADDWPNYFIQEAEKISGRDVVFLADFRHPGTIVQQLSVIYAIPRHGARSFKVIIPFFPGTMDRVQEYGEIVTTMTLARMLSATPLTRTGPTEIIILDVHDLHEQFYFTDNVLVRLESIIPELLWSVPRQDDLAFCFPDEGAFKRFHRIVEQQRPGTLCVVCEKRRGPDGERLVTIKDGDPSGRQVWIIDDLVQGGGTLVHAAEALRVAGAASVSMLVPHAVCPNESWKRFASGKHQQVFCTSDSIPSTAKQIFAARSNHVRIVPIHRTLKRLIESWY